MDTKVGSIMSSPPICCICSKVVTRESIPIDELYKNGITCSDCGKLVKLILDNQRDVDRAQSNLSIAVERLEKAEQQLRHQANKSSKCE